MLPELLAAPPTPAPLPPERIVIDGPPMTAWPPPVELPPKPPAEPRVFRPKAAPDHGPLVPLWLVLLGLAGLIALLVGLLLAR